MKKLVLAIALLCLVPLSAQASPLSADQLYAPTSGMQFFFGTNGPITMPWSGNPNDTVPTGYSVSNVYNKTFDQSSNVSKEAVVVYDFATNGGGSGAYISLAMPAALTASNAIIYNAWMDAATTITGSGASLELHAKAAGDILATTAISSWSSGQKQGVPTAGNVTNAIKGATGMVLHITGAALTAGHFTIFLDYSLSQ